MGIYTSYGIPYMVMAKLAEQGYVEPIDLSTRCKNECECLSDAAKQYGFATSTSGYEEHISRLAGLCLASAMRLVFLFSQRPLALNGGDKTQ